MWKKIKENLSSPEWDSLKAIVVIGLVVVAGIFVISKSSLRSSVLPGLVDPLNAVSVDIVLSSSDAEPVEKYIYGVGLAKYWDEIGPWGDSDIEQALTDLDINSVRNVGGVVKYQRVWLSDTQVASLLSPSEQAALLPGNELRGFGNIIADREAEEAKGNTGEIDEITGPKNKYGGMSYLDGYQNTLPRNFIHDIVDIANTSDAAVSYTVNINYGTPAEAAQQISFLADEGIEVAYVELGNEVYSKDNDYWISGDPTVKAPIAVDNYLADADTFKAAISAEVPGVKFAVVSAPKKGFEETTDGFDGDSDFNTEWNKALAQKMTAHGYENYVMHFYHNFTPCWDEYASMDRDSIFECSKVELRNFNNEGVQYTDSVNLPPILDYYHDTFTGKNLILTEWNINQDPTRTNSTLANSILHAAFTNQFIDILNQSNAKHGNFIKLASYHTFGTDGGNAMVNKRSVSNNAANSEPEDIGEFVRRTPYFAMQSWNRIFDNGFTPMNTSYTFDSADDTLQEDIVISGYDDTDGEVALFVSNLTDQTIDIGSISIDSKTISLDKSKYSITYIDGTEIYSSKGATEFAKAPGFETNFIEEDSQRLSDLFIPAYGTGVIYITPKVVEADTDNNTGTGADIEVSPDNNANYSSQTVTYATTAAGTALQFDLSKPEGAENPLPLIFFLHGGSFDVGGLDTIDDFVSDFTGAGYATAEVSYRGVNERLFPAQVQDINGAIRYVRAHAAELNIDPNKIAIAGSSSGGMMMSLVGTSSEVAEFEGTTGGNTTFSSKPDAVINMFGSIDPDDVFGGMPGGIQATFLTLFGCNTVATCDKATEAAAALYADANDPAFLILHGTADAGYQNSIKLQGIFEDAGIDSTLISAPGVGHDKNTILTLHAGDIIEFLDTHFYSASNDVEVPGDDCGFFENLFGGCDEPAEDPEIVPEESDTIAPKISIKSPANQTIITESTVMIEVETSDAGGISKVEFYQGKTLLGSDTASPYKYSWDTSDLSNGPYSLRTISYDNAGNSSTAQVKVKKN